MYDIMTFECPVCGREYEQERISLTRNYKQPDGEIVNYIVCTKDGAPALTKVEATKGNVIGEAVIGEMIIG